MGLLGMGPAKGWMVAGLALIAVPWVLFVGLLWWGQEHLIFPGTWLLRGADARRAPWATVIEIPREDGLTVPLLLSAHGNDRLVLMAHGNGELAADMAAYAEVLAKAGWDLAVIEYRGYGGVGGWPTEPVLAGDLVAAVEVLEARGYALDRTIVHGRSIGGGVGSTLLDERIPAGLVLESTFDSLAAVVRERWYAAVVPVGLLLRSPLDTRARVARTGVPTFQVHDATDHVIPLERAEQVAVDERHVTRGHPHGEAIVLVDPSVRTRWLAWLDERVPAS